MVVVTVGAAFAITVRARDVVEAAFAITDRGRVVVGVGVAVRSGILNAAMTCKVCGGSTILSDAIGGTHKCPPKWRVWEQVGDDRDCERVVRAYDPVFAAAAWAEDYASDMDYCLVDSYTIVHVQLASEQGETVRVKVRGESTVTYYAEMYKE